MPEPYCIIIPLDARPVCYQQVLDLAAIGNVSVSLPPQGSLGVLKQPADLARLYDWWEIQCRSHPQAGVVLSLDTLAYGGLIASRVNTDSLDTLKQRVDRFLACLGQSHHPRYGMTSVLRIPHYNNAEEEPDYWAHYGELLYQWSVVAHQSGCQPEAGQIPPEVLRDFLSRREKNFALSQSHLALLAKGLLDYLVFAQDDTGPHGLNVQEAQAIAQQLAQTGLTHKGVVQTGADEVALTLLVRILWQQSAQPLKVHPWFFPAGGEAILAKFDGVPIGQVVERQLHTLGAHWAQSPEDADLILMVNAPPAVMGDHCAAEVFVPQEKSMHPFVQALQTWLPQKAVAIADVAYANGADPKLIEACLAAGVAVNQLAGYAAWNTPGNTMGTAVAMGGMVVWAKHHQRYDKAAHEKLLLTRFLDDWVYQANVRYQLRALANGSPPSEARLNDAMQPAWQPLEPLFSKLQGVPRFTFPCRRLFEIAVELPAYA